MKSRIYAPFVYLLGTILVLGALCGPGTTVAPTLGVSTSAGTVATPVQGNSGNAVNNIQDVQKATIQIESNGTFEDPQQGLVLNAAGRGSGFIIDPSGLAVTNNHVVTGAALIRFG
jgi:serine protease Do